MTGKRVYPWHQLQVPGDTFKWPMKRDEGSLRAQASKQAKRQSIEISVQLVDDGLLVTYVAGVL